MIATIFGGFLLLLSGICGVLILSYVVLKISGKATVGLEIVSLWALFFVCGFVGLWLLGALHFSK